MVSKLFSASPFWQDGALGLARFTVGIFMIYHGVEVFDEKKMADYSKWLTDIHFTSPAVMSYLGKATEFVSGIFVTLGLLTRLAVIPLAITMSIICFGLGEGRIFMEDQHPFLFILLAFIFFFCGPGRYSLDYLILQRRRAVLES